MKLANTAVNIIQTEMNSINTLITDFLTSLDQGLIIDLEPLENRVALVCGAIGKLDDNDFVNLKDELFETLERVRQLRDFLNTELENTAMRIRMTDAAQKATFSYQSANDNL